MALSIKNEEADRLSRELARRQGKTITEAVIDALRAELEREKRRLRPEPIVDRLLATARRYSTLPTLDDRTPDEIIGYDRIGLPR